MALIISSIKIPIEVGGETVNLICRRPTAKELSSFLSSRFVQKRNKMQSRIYEARSEFIDQILVDVENAQVQNAAGDVLEITKDLVLTEDDKRHLTSSLGDNIENWRDLIPLNWKASAAMYFEDQHQAAPDEEGN